MRSLIMPIRLFPLPAADSAEAKAVPQAQSEQGQQPWEGLTEEDSPLLSFLRFDIRPVSPAQWRGFRPGERLETGTWSPRCSCCISTHRRRRHKCEIGIFLKNEGWGWPAKGTAARKKKSPVCHHFLHRGRLRLLYNTHLHKQTLNTPSTPYRPPRVLPWTHHWLMCC